VAIEKNGTRKPRVRKIETVRERAEKATAKTEAKAGKSRNRPLRRAARAVVSPLRTPARVVATPFTKRPVRFVFRWIGLILWPPYFRNAFRELRQVTWPSRKDTWKLTLAVLIFAIIFGLLATLTDYGLDKIIRRIVFR
jgi:preprotein translocase SecE subunit